MSEEIPKKSKVDKSMNNAVALLSTLLLPNEQLTCHGFQIKFLAIIAFKRRTLVATTSSRLIILKRGLFGGFDMKDVQWQDVNDAKIKEGFLPSLFGASLEIATTKGLLTLAGIHTAPARTIYTKCQEQEQSWREKNRIRDMEVMRAKAGGVHIGGEAMSSGSNHPSNSPPVEDVVEKLKKAKEMLVAGLISDAEYETIKSKYINSL